MQIVPAELESVLLSHPAVADAAVLRTPDPDAGELPFACVVLKADVSASSEEIQEYVAGKWIEQVFLNVRGVKALRTRATE